MGYARAVSENLRVERGWIFVNGTRQDDGTIEIGTGGEMRFSPFEAMAQRQGTPITLGPHPHGVGPASGFLAPLSGTNRQRHGPAGRGMRERPVPSWRGCHGEGVWK